MSSCKDAMRMNILDIGPMKVLVSGAGIVGSAASLCLSTGGHDVVVIDKALSFSRRGYLLSLKFFGIAIMKSLGLWDQLQQFGMPYRAFQIHNAKGKLVKKLPEDLEEKATKGSIPLQRPDLHQVLYAATGLTEVRFGTHIADLVQDDNSLTATYSDGRSERSDMVVIAKLLRFLTRQLLWGEGGLHSFGIIYAATITDANHAVPQHVFQIYFNSEMSDCDA